MFAWWDTLSTLLKVLYCITLPATLILVIQTVLILIGFDGGGEGIDVSDTSGLDMDMDVDLDMDVTDLPDDIPTDAELMTDGGNPADFAAMRLFTLQTVIAFITVFGWSSIVSIQVGAKIAWSMLIGALLGFIAMFLVAKLVQLSLKLQENGTLQLKNALGQTATVYTPIPANAKGFGKVTFILQGRFTEHEAITEGDRDLPVGTEVRIVDIIGDKLIVEGGI
ncbi:MAG: NfeD family protein [Clostridia bacterium]|nr:NfeD family protein [Clostridia bacterium]